MVQTKGALPHPCGQCVSCRINKRREWAIRMLIEAATHKYSQFWTLTYEDEYLPPARIAGQPDVLLQKNLTGASVHTRTVGGQPGELRKYDLQCFFKRYRKRFQGLPLDRFRYFAVGEYGEKRGRPHYHVIAFGANVSVQELQDLWPAGHVHIGEVNSATIHYVTEYALKSKEKNNDLSTIWRAPEFSLISSKPGIGEAGLPSIRKLIFNTNPHPVTGEYLIPDYLVALGKKWPMPRYLRRILEDEGFVSFSRVFRRDWRDQNVLSYLLDHAPDSAKREYREHFLPLLDPNSEEVAKNKEKRRQRLINSEVRRSIFGVRHETL